MSEVTNSWQFQQLLGGAIFLHITENSQNFLGDEGNAFWMIFGKIDHFLFGVSIWQCLGMFINSLLLLVTSANVALCSQNVLIVFAAFYVI